MGKKKIKYEMIINQKGNVDDVFLVQYGSVKNIEIQLMNEGICILVNTTSMITGEMILANENTLFSNVIQKGILLYMIKYSRGITIVNFSFSVDGEKTDYSGTQFPFYCMIDRNSVLNLSNNWQSQFVYDFIREYKEKYKVTDYNNARDLQKKAARRLMASAFAFLTAKTQKYEYEKFSYLWIAMNGMYGYVSHLYEPSGQKMRLNLRKKLTEVEEMSVLWHCLGWDEGDRRKWNIKYDDKKIIYDKVSRILNGINAEMSFEELENELFERETGNRIRDVLHSWPKDQTEQEEYNVSPKIYVIFFLPYFVRCNYFHANKPFPLIANKQDKNNHVLKLINKLLDRFLDETITSWMNYEYARDNYLTEFDSFHYGQ